MLIFFDQNMGGIKQTCGINKPCGRYRTQEYLLLKCFVMTLSSGVVAKVMSGKRASDAMQRTTTAVTIFNAGYKVCQLTQIMIYLLCLGYKQYLFAQSI